MLSTTAKTTITINSTFEAKLYGITPS